MYIKHSKDGYWRHHTQNESGQIRGDKKLSKTKAKRYWVTQSSRTFAPPTLSGCVLK